MRILPLTFTLSFLFAVVFATASAPSETYPMKNLANSFGDEKAPKNIEISVLDADQLAELFRTLAADKSIPFRYPMDGCEDRATAMALDAEKKNIIVGKVFIEGALKVRLSHPLYPQASWRRHVAPVVYVKASLGFAKLVVLDPSLFDHPVSVQELQQRLLTDIEEEKPVIFETYYGSKYQSHMKEAEEYKTSWDPQYLKDVRETLKEYLQYQDDSSKAPKGREWKQGALKLPVKEKSKRVPSTETPEPARRPHRMNVDRRPFL